MAQEKFTVIKYDSRFLPAFVELNTQWIEKYFRLETMDLIQLKNPQKFILEPGGEIFFVLEGEKAIGTCAMIPHGEKSYEIAKMAVRTDARGQGVGDILMKTAIDWAHCQRANSITILSNTVLEPAISLYKKHGFLTVHLGAHPDYERCNIEMKMDLKGT